MPPRAIGPAAAPAAALPTNFNRCPRGAAAARRRASPSHRAVPTPLPCSPKHCRPPGGGASEAGDTAATVAKPVDSGGSDGGTGTSGGTSGSSSGDSGSSGGLNAGTVLGAGFAPSPSPPPLAPPAPPGTV